MTKEEKTVGEKAVELLVENGYEPEDKIEGCTDDEIRELEKKFGVTLPEAYKSCILYHYMKDNVTHRRRYAP
ncbi:MAG: SMI1/KNR4 family protein [Halobacteria archaeon]|nr:SMI1/KNR4 family protein [Halobacteria archaeon]